MSHLHLKENSYSGMNNQSKSLPPARLGKKRRSSILKQERPFTEVQNLSRGRDDSRTAKERRVSWCPTIEVKEFYRHKPTDTPSKSVSSQGDEENVEMKQVSQAAGEDVPQMSTPVRKKKRRISTASQIDRLSIIPKFEKSFTFPEDDDFPIFDDTATRPGGGCPPPATARREDITLYEEPHQHNDILEGDALLVNDVITNPTSQTRESQCPPPPPPSSSCPPPPSLPSLTPDDEQRLAELFPGASVPCLPPAAHATPPLSTTVLTHPRLYYMKMTTPDMVDTPQRRKRQSQSPWIRGGGGGETRDNDQNTTIGADSPLSRGATFSEPRLMSLTCLESSHTQIDRDHTLVDQSHTRINHTNNEESVQTRVTFDPRITTVRDSMAMALTCVGEEEEEEGVKEEAGSAMVLTCVENNEEESRASPETESAMVLTCEGEGEEEAGTCRLRLAVTASMAAEEKEGEGSQTMVMDLTCQSETSLSNMTTTITSENGDHLQDNSHTTSVNQTMRPPTEQEEEDTAMPRAEDRPVSEDAPPPPPPQSTSPMFKAPKAPFRSHLKLRSSEKREVVAATPMARTPRLIHRHSSLLSSSSSSASLRPQLNTTFTISQTTPSHLSSRTPAAELQPSTISSEKEEKEEDEEVDVEVDDQEPSSIPPSPSLSNPSCFPTTTIPTYRPTSREGEERREHHLASSVLASPSVPTPLQPIASGTDCAWLQVTAEDSFRLISSDSDTSPTQQEEQQHHPVLPDGVQLQLDSQGNLSFITPTVQPPLSETTPTAAGHTDPTQLTEALERLRMTMPSLPPPLLGTINTPEVVQLVETIPPIGPSEDLLPPPSTRDLNDTTFCGGGGHSPTLSASIYHKFLDHINRGKPHTNPATTSADCTSTLTLPASISTETQIVAVRPSTKPFSSFLSDITSCLHGVLESVLGRLNSQDYCSTHHYLTPVLNKWSRVFAACLGTLTVLQQYGGITGESDTCDWDSASNSSSELPLPPLGEEDMQQHGNSMKLEWIMELSGFYKSLTRIAELARDKAAELYGWLFEEWTHDSHIQNVTLILGSKTHQFQISVSDITADRIKATREVTSTIWRHIRDNRGSNTT